MTSSVKIVPYNPGLAGHFNRLWVTWLRDTMGKEPQAEDLEAVDYPENFYIAGGGAVFFAVPTKDSEPVGVVAVKNLGDGCYEFCKLVVADKARGCGAGRGLVEACIAFAISQNAVSLYLQSFRALETAVQMYQHMGFIDCEPPHSMSVLARTEIIMKLPISSRAS